MAKGIDESALTLNAKENPDFAKFVIEQVFEQLALSAIHRVWTGITMKEQIVFASLFGKVGIKDTTCARPTSGAKSVLTEKFWEPEKVGDTLILCNSEVSALFKAYFDKISRFEELYDITGSDEEKFILAMFVDAISKAVLRYVWFGDKDVVQASAAVTGLLLAADVKFYDSVNGIFKKIFAGVTATDIKRYTIAENAEITKAAQLALADNRALAIFEGIWEIADPRLRARTDKRFLVTHAIFENYRKSMQAKGENFNIDYTMDGFPSLKWNGVDIIDMETIWDLDLQTDFVDNTTNNAYYLPNRVVLTVADNIPVGTLNEGDMDELEAWYNKDERLNKMAYGHTLDALYLEGYMISVAY